MINTLPSPKTNKKAKRIGRGMGTGVGGHTVGRGGKGATARSGHKDPGPSFEGGQNPISRRLPRAKGIPTKGHGFTSGNFKKSKIMNVAIKLSVLAERASKSRIETITMNTLSELNLLDIKVSTIASPKILLDKEIDVKLKISGVKASRSATDAIIKAGGSVE